MGGYDMHEKRSRKLKVMLFVGMVLVLVLLSGCGSTTTENEENQSQGGGSTRANDGVELKEEPVEIDFMTISYATETPKMPEVLNAIETYTNTKIEIDFVPSTVYAEKVNAMLASGDLPKAIMVPDVRAPIIVNGARSGMFWEIGPYLDEYPNLSQLNPNTLQNIAIDGKVYGLYRGRPLARNGVIFRKDWLDNLGLEEPKTIDDIYNMMKAFTEDDPDQNGVNDTYGFTEDENLTGFDTLSAYFGAPNGWEFKDGVMVPDFMTEEYMDTVRFYKQIYDEKLMNQDFAITKGTMKADNVNSGSAGVYIATLSDVGNRFPSLFSNDPNAELDVVSRISGPKGERVHATAGFNGEFLFPKSSVKTEEELKAILQFFDKMLDDEMNDLLFWGIEGLHYKEENGKRERINFDKWLLEVNGPILHLRLVTNDLVYADSDPEVEIKSKVMQKENEDIAVYNPTLPLVSETIMERGTELDKIIEDARIQFIMGKIDQDGWDQAIQQWHDNGGAKVIEEFTEEYKKLN